MNKLGIFMNFWERDWAADHLRYIRKAADLGYDILEFQAQPMLDKTDGECRNIAAEARAAGIELTYSLGLDPRFDISSPDPEVRRAGVDYLQKIVRKIAVMEGTLFSGVTFAGWGAPAGIVEHADKEAMLARSAESMRDVARAAEREGIVICVEAVNRFESALINTAEEALRYAVLTDCPNLGVHLDTYHMNIEEESIGDAIRLAGPRIRHFHTGENNRTPPGRGHLDWGEIFSALAEVKYAGRIVSEPFVRMGGEVGRDIRVYRDLLPDLSEGALDGEALRLLGFTRSMIEKYAGA